MSGSDDAIAAARRGAEQWDQLLLAQQRYRDGLTEQTDEILAEAAQRMRAVRPRP